MVAISRPVTPTWEELNEYDKRWVMNTEQRRALYKVPRRPFPAEPWKAWTPPAPVVLEPVKEPEKKKWPGFWLWLGNSRLLWFVLDAPGAIRRAWRQAGRHAKSTFSLDDSFLLE